MADPTTTTTTTPSPAPQQHVIDDVWIDPATKRGVMRLDNGREYNIAVGGTATTRMLDALTVEQWRIIGERMLSLQALDGRPITEETDGYERVAAVFSKERQVPEHHVRKVSRSSLNFTAQMAARQAQKIWALTDIPIERGADLTDRIIMIDALVKQRARGNHGRAFQIANDKASVPSSKAFERQLWDIVTPKILSLHSQLVDDAIGQKAQQAVENADRKLLQRAVKAAVRKFSMDGTVHPLAARLNEIARGWIETVVEPRNAEQSS